MTAAGEMYYGFHGERHHGNELGNTWKSGSGEVATAASCFCVDPRSIPSHLLAATFITCRRQQKVLKHWTGNDINSKQ